MKFLFAGAADRAVPIGLEVIARLPQGTKLTLEAPAILLRVRVVATKDSKG